MECKAMMLRTKESFPWFQVALNVRMFCHGYNRRLGSSFSAWQLAKRWRGQQLMQQIDATGGPISKFVGPLLDTTSCLIGRWSLPKLCLNQHYERRGCGMPVVVVLLTALEPTHSLKYAEFAPSAKCNAATRVHLPHDYHSFGSTDRPMFPFLS